MAWFPVFAELIESAEFKRLTPTEKLYFLYLISRFNRDGQFFQADDEISATLATDVKTIRRGRTKLEKMGLIQVIPGRLTKRKRCLATQYLKVRYARIKSGEDRHYAQIHRFTFEAVISRFLRKGHLRPGDVLVWIVLYCWYWRNRGKRDDHQFYIMKEKLQSLTCLRDAPNRMERIYNAFTFNEGSHLFEFQDKHQRIVIKNWLTCADPEENEFSCQNAERYRQEIKELVERKKHYRELKAQQRIAAMLPKKSKGPVHPRNLLLLFNELYLKKYGREPNRRGEAKIHTLEHKYGRGPIYRAINWYFKADTVPNGSGAKTRTLGNFVCHIGEILKLSAKAAFV